MPLLPWLVQKEPLVRLKELPAPGTGHITVCCLAPGFKYQPKALSKSPGTSRKVVLSPVISSPVSTRNILLVARVISVACLGTINFQLICRRCGTPSSDCQPCSTMAGRRDANAGVLVGQITLSSQFFLLCVALRASWETWAS